VTDSGKNRINLLTAEPVEGQLLADRLEQGALPPLEAVRVAIEVGSALHEAHGRGLVHAGISPGTVLLTARGAVVLQPPEDGRHALCYRSPEQVRDGSADTRSDIFSFGALLYEMLTGRRAFLAAPNTIDETILTVTPPAIKSRLPVVTAAENAIAGCLEKDRDKRRQRIKNVVADLKLARAVQVRVSAARRPENARVRVEMQPVVGAAQETALAGGLRKAPPRPMYVDVVPVNGFQKRLWLVAALGLVLCAAAVAAVMLLPSARGTREGLGYRLDMIPPDNVKFAGTPAISPDGTNIAYTATGPEGKRMIWIRGLDDAHARVLPSTEGAFAPFWSPDGSYLAYFSNDSLKKIKSAASDPPAAPEVICPVEALPGGGAWNAENTILFASGLTTGIYRVPAAGGKPAAVTKLDEAHSEQQHLWPHFLPDGKHFFFFVRSEAVEDTGVYLASLDSAQHTKLVRSDGSAIFAMKPDAKSAADGYMLYIQDRNLVGQPFDADKLVLPNASPRELVADVGSVESLGLSEISASNSGILIYQAVGKSTRHLVWMNRKGDTISEFGQAADWGPPRISPDGKHVAVGKLDENSDNAHVWILDATNARGAQVTNTPDATDVSPVWSTDGSRIAYVTWRPKEFSVYVKPASVEGKSELVNVGSALRHLEDWSRDGRFLLASEFHTDTGWDVMLVNLADKKSSPILDTVHTEAYGALSSDGKWLAYQSNESGNSEIYVQLFDNGAPGTKRVYQISKGGGMSPRWRRDGGELYFLSADGHMMAAPTNTAGSEFTFGPAELLFQTRQAREPNLYDVSADGERFLLNLPMEWPSAAPITVQTGWAKELAQPIK
jgi:Tol biopolymer transport system component